MTLPELLADLVMMVHAAFSLFVVLGLVLVLTGLLLRWSWTNSQRFRVIHLAATLIVVARVWIEVPCPFSALEDYLRAQTSVSCAAGAAFHDFFHRLAFRGADSQRFARSTTAVGFVALATFAFSTRLRRSTTLEVPRASSG